LAFAEAGVSATESRLPRRTWERQTDDAR